MCGNEWGFVQIGYSDALLAATDTEDEAFAEFLRASGAKE